MNFNLPHIPERDAKPRQRGITMMMDKGLSTKEVENFIDANAAYTDLLN
jgi:phosphosulfolactate synthase